VSVIDLVLLALLIATILVGAPIMILAGRRRLAWRLDLDQPVLLAPRGATKLGNWKIFREGHVAAGHQVAFLQVRNSGKRTLDNAAIRGFVGFEFPGRQVVQAVIPELEEVATKRDRASSATLHTAKPSEKTARVVFDRIDLRPKGRVKVLVLLTGRRSDDQPDVVVCGELNRGRIIRETHSGIRRTFTTDLPNTANYLFPAMVAALGLVLAGIVIGQPNFGGDCVAGTIEVEGSSEFGPVANSVELSYQHNCPSSNINIVEDSSSEGQRDLINSHQSDWRGPVVDIAMSDGGVPTDQAGSLVDHPIGVVTFAVVVNRSTAVTNLSTGDLVNIFTGKVQDWSQIRGGRSQPVIVVRRVDTSGTRNAFDSYVIGTEEIGHDSSTSCRSKNAPTALPGDPVVCTVGTTQQLIDQVATTPGAIGYAELGAATGDKRIRAIEINSVQPSIDSVERNIYTFWTVEHLFTNGSPPPQSLTQAFLDYLGQPTALGILRGSGFTPCVDPGINTLCRQR
jgi:phosphate transport system substrate-binding protein